MLFPLPKGVAFLRPLSLSIPASHWHRGRNIYSGPVLRCRVKKKGGGRNTWLKCLAVSFMPRREQQTNLPLRGSKPRSGLLDRCVITHYDCGVLTCRYASTHMTCSCGSSHGCTSVSTLEWGSAFIPWQIIKYSVIASSGWGVSAIYHPVKQQGCDIPEMHADNFLIWCALLSSSFTKNKE